MKLVRIYCEASGRLCCVIDGVKSLFAATAMMIPDVIDGNESSYVFDGGMF